VNRAPIVEFKHVSFGYTSELVLEDVSFQIDNQEAACIVGANGSGKSTLLKLMLGLLEPIRGSIQVAGKTPKSAQRKMGYVPQHLHFDPLFPITVWEVVMTARLGPHCLRFGKRALDQAATEQALVDTSLIDLRNRSFQTLSGGQKQRVLIARALACNPEILILDEPTANLDIAIEFKLLEALLKLRSHMTLVMVSHDLDFVSQIVQKVLCVNKHVVVHHTHAFSEKMLKEAYGSGLRIIHHNESCHHD
jgi:zinc transport system ATP-binding protein